MAKNVSKNSEYFQCSHNINITAKWIFILSNLKAGGEKNLICVKLLCFGTMLFQIDLPSALVLLFNLSGK